MSPEKGKIICVIGHQATGKSTLARALGESLDCQVFLEGEEKDFPDFVIEEFKQKKNRLPTSLFFHNQYLRQWHEAEWLRERNEIVVLDSFWLTNYFFQDSFDNAVNRHLFKDLLILSAAQLTKPDIIFSLNASDEIIRERVRIRGRQYEDESYWSEIMNVKARYRNFLDGPDELKRKFVDVPIVEIDTDDSIENILISCLDYIQNPKN